MTPNNSQTLLQGIVGAMMPPDSLRIMKDAIVTLSGMPPASEVLNTISRLVVPRFEVPTFAIILATEPDDDPDDPDHWPMRTPTEMLHFVNDPELAKSILKMAPDMSDLAREVAWRQWQEDQQARKRGKPGPKPPEDDPSAAYWEHIDDIIARKRKQQSPGVIAMHHGISDRTVQKYIATYHRLVREGKQATRGNS